MNKRYPSSSSSPVDSSQPSTLPVQTFSSLPNVITSSSLSTDVAPGPSPWGTGKSHGSQTSSHTTRNPRGSSDPFSSFLSLNFSRSVLQSDPTKTPTSLQSCTRSVTDSITRFVRCDLHPVGLIRLPGPPSSPFSPVPWSHCYSLTRPTFSSSVPVFRVGEFLPKVSPTSRLGPVHLWVSSAPAPARRRRSRRTVLSVFGAPSVDADPSRRTVDTSSYS